MKSLKYAWVATHTFWQKKYFVKKQWVATHAYLSNIFLYIKKLIF